jgi:hypothetical protein
MSRIFTIFGCLGMDHQHRALCASCSSLRCVQPRTHLQDGSAAKQAADMRRTSRREERDSGEHGKADNSRDSAHARRAAGFLSMVHHRDDGRVLSHAL